LGTAWLGGTYAGRAALRISSCHENIGHADRIFQGQSDVGGALLPGSASYDPGTKQYTITSAGYGISACREALLLAIPATESHKIANKHLDLVSTLQLQVSKIVRSQVCPFRAPGSSVVGAPYKEEEILERRLGSCFERLISPGDNPS